MLRSQAIARINQGLGFRATGNALEANIVLMLQEAQRFLEKGKTLPKFLLQEGQTLTLAEGAHTTALPTGFLRESDENPLHLFPTDSSKPRYLRRRIYRDAAQATDLIQEDDPDEAAEPGAPRVYTIRKSTVDFITNADQEYILYWDYYKAADVLVSDAENAWLAYVPEWLIGEAGFRLAMDLRDNDAVTKFDRLRNDGYRATMGELVTAEISSGVLQMGANL